MSSPNQFKWVRFYPRKESIHNRVSGARGALLGEMLAEAQMVMAHGSDACPVYVQTAIK